MDLKLKKFIGEDQYTCIKQIISKYKLNTSNVSKYVNHLINELIEFVVDVFGDIDERKNLSLELRKYGTLEFVLKLSKLSEENRYEILNEWSWDVDGLTMENIINKNVKTIDWVKRVYNIYKLNNIKPPKEKLSMNWAEKMVEKYQADPSELIKRIENKYNIKRGVKWETMG